MVDKQERRVRRVKNSQSETNGSAGYLEKWGGIVSGIVEMDVGAVHARLRAELTRSVKIGSALMDAFDRVATCYADACELKDRARYEYELYKEDFETWQEPKRTVALQEMEKAKKAGELKKTISDSMVMDWIRAAWPDEYRVRREKVLQFQAAVHTIEKLPDAFRMRAKALTDQKDMLLKLGAGVAG